MLARTKTRRTKIQEVPLKFNGDTLMNAEILERLSPEKQRNIAEHLHELIKEMLTGSTSVAADDVFSEIESKYTKPGVLLRGLRVREDLTQQEFADKLGIEQSAVSAMEKGTRPIGRNMAKRIAEAFDVDYRMFL